jgi:glycosyltransferase involved in cell wall biosynthesis
MRERSRKPRVAIAGIRGIPANFGGSETVVEQLGEIHAQWGWDIVVYCRRHRNTTDASHHKGMRRVVLPSINKLGLDTPTHSLLSTLHVIATNSADLVHFHGVGNAMFAPILRLFGKRTVITVDGFDWRRPKWGPTARWVLRRSFEWAVKWADAVIADNRPVHDWIRSQLGGDTHLIHYGTDLSQVEGEEALARFGLKSREYMLFVGALVPDKGAHLLLEAYEGLATDKKLVVVGDTPYFSDYADKLRSTQDKRVVFTGYLYGKEYRQLLQHAYVYAHPLLAEGTSPALLQAMAARNCVVVGDLPETLDVVGDTAIVFKRGDPVAMRERLGYALAHPEEVADRRARARRRVEEQFTWPRIAAQHAGVYEEATA